MHQRNGYIENQFISLRDSTTHFIHEETVSWKLRKNFYHKLQLFNYKNLQNVQHNTIRWGGIFLSPTI